LFPGSPKVDAAGGERVLWAPRLDKTAKHPRAKLERKCVDTQKLLREAAEKLEGIYCERSMLKQLARMEYCIKCTPEVQPFNVTKEIYLIMDF